MRNRRLLSILLALALLMGFALPALAIPAHPGPRTLTQPDGTTIVAYMLGDEYQRYYVDAEGTPLVKGADDFYRAMDVSAAGEGASFSQFAAFGAQAPALNTALLQSERGTITLSGAGAVRETPMLVLAIGYENQGEVDELYERWPWLSTTAEAWAATVFGEEHSVRDYYRDASNGRFTVVPAAESDGVLNDGVVMLHLPHDSRYRPDEVGVNSPDYDIANNRWRKSQIPAEYYHEDDMEYQWYVGFSVLEALELAQQYVDFASFDVKAPFGKLTMDELIVYCPIAGYEKANDATLHPSVWAVRATLEGTLAVYDENGDYSTWGPAKLGGTGRQVTLDDYMISGEWDVLRYADGTEYYHEIASYATACHELGHILSLPDLYNTNARKKATLNVGALSVMATGCLGRLWDKEKDATGKIEPTFLDAWCKARLGFHTPVAAAPGETYTLYDASRTADYNMLRLDTTDPNEYYLVENRQYAGYDEFMRSDYAYRQWDKFQDEKSTPGVVVWHIREDINARWRDGQGSNDINTPEYGYGVMQEFVKEGNDAYPFRTNVQGETFLYDVGDGTVGSLEVLSPSGGEMQVRYTVLTESDDTGGASGGTPSMGESAALSTMRGTDTNGARVTLTRQALDEKRADFQLLKAAAGTQAVFAAYEVNAGDYTNVTFPLSITFDVGVAYAGETFTVLHKIKSGAILRYTGVVDAAGKLTIQVNELSPFMLLRGRAAHAASTVTTVPATGGTAGALGALPALGCMLWAVAVAETRRRKL
ncbi:MAG: hypothetical protein Q4E65_08100 [Clostridia bacterium]|nr:hypothetical protein [Clostridia bacterium]